MSFFKKSKNIYILLISIAEIISSNKKNTVLEYCEANKNCNDCVFCGEGIKDYNLCSYYNLFCTKKIANYIIFQESYLTNYSAFFRNIPNANEFCGQETYTINSLIGPFSIINKSIKNIKNSNIYHCNYEIYNNRYYYNYIDLANLIIKFKTNKLEKNNLKFILNIIIKNSRLSSTKLIIIHEEDLIKEYYDLSLYNYDTIIILLDFYIDGEINENIEEYLEIRINTDNKSVKKRNRLTTIVLIIVFSFLAVSIIAIIIFACYQSKRSRNIKLKRKKTEAKINKLFETTLIPEEFNENEITNNCTECTICIEKFVDKCLICNTPCKHIFHFECLKKFVETAKGKQKIVIKCPLCNYDFLEEKNNDKKLKVINIVNNVNNKINNNRIYNNENNMRPNNSTIRPRVVTVNHIKHDGSKNDSSEQQCIN